VLEVSAEKPGNITPSHDFHDTTYEDMLRSAIAVGPELARAGTLIARKRGAEAAARVSAGAREVLCAGGVRTAAGRRALRSFDASLREPGNALNPGTTADLVTATLFVALLEGIL
jgi:triphosphoribosyl-dephospho-CoA synthetase